MAVQFEMTIDNFDKFKNLLAQQQKEALEAVGMFVQGEAKVRTPVGQYDDGRVGGRLRDSIDYKVTSDNQSVQIGTDVEYAIYVEKGTYKMAAQPYLTPSAEENVDKIRQLLVAQIERLSTQ